MSKLQTIIKLIHQGNHQALSTFFNEHLNRKGLYLKFAPKANNLNILVESKNEPPQDPIVKLIINAFKSHQFRHWPSLKIYGKKQGEDFPTWIQEINISDIMPSMTELAKQGNIQVLQEILENHLKTKVDFTSLKLSFKDFILRVKVEHEIVPQQNDTVELLTKAIQTIGFSQVITVHIYGQELSEDFPDWHVQTTIKPEQKAEVEQKSIPDRTSVPQEQKPSISDQSSSLITEKLIGFDPVTTSNQLYQILNTQGFSSFIKRDEEVADKSDVHEIVEIFIEDLEDDLKIDLVNFSVEVKKLIKSLNLSNISDLEVRIDQSKQEMLEIGFSSVKSNLKNFRKITQEILNQEFPNDLNWSEILITGAAEFAGLGSTKMSKEAAIGTMLGSIIAPGVGTVLGAAIGGWMGGQKQAEKLEAMLDKYTEAKEKLINSWNSLLGEFYTSIQRSFDEIIQLSLIDFSALEKAWKNYEKAVEILEEFKINESLDQEEITKQLSKIIKIYEEALHLNPGLALAWNDKGYVLTMLKQYPEALEIFDHAIELEPNLVAAYINKADALRELEDSKIALDVYEQALNLDPDCEEALLGKALALVDLEEYRSALDHILALIDKNPDSTLLYGIKALLLVRSGEDTLALDALERLSQLDYSEFSDLIREEEVFQKFQDNEIFIKLLESSIGIDYSRLKTYLHQKDWKQADFETRNILSLLVPKSSQSDKVNKNSIEKIPCQDLATLDRIWRESSEGKFGFSSQATIYAKCGSNNNSFGLAVGWCKVEDNAIVWQNQSSVLYKLEKMEEGYLPSLLWAGESGWLESRMDRLCSIFKLIESNKELFY